MKQRTIRILLKIIYLKRIVFKRHWFDFGEFSIGAAHIDEGFVPCTRNIINICSRGDDATLIFSIINFIQISRHLLWKETEMNEAIKNSIAAISADWCLMKWLNWLLKLVWYEFPFPHWFDKNAIIQMLSVLKNALTNIVVAEAEVKCWNQCKQ